MPPTHDTTAGLGPATPRSVAVIGAGYVGLTLAACLALGGHRVRCTDASAARVEELRRGVVPIVEEGLTEIVTQVVAAGRLTFGTDNLEAVREAEVTFLCLPTPEGADGRADLSFVEAVASQIGPDLRPGAMVVTKSTVPVGTSLVVERALGRPDVHVVSNPEFLAEGSAVRDCLRPDRVVVGARRPDVALSVAALYGPEAELRSIITDLASAELVKYASNAYLATRLTFVNAVAELCEAVGADIRAVTAGMGADHRIGPSFLRPGPGWGGSCFPKDTVALLRTAEQHGCNMDLLRQAIHSNAEHTRRVVDKVARALGGEVEGARVAVWGLTFKAGTDDRRQSPAMQIARQLHRDGADVHAYDPTVEAGSLDGLRTHRSSFAACADADVLVVATEWPEFATADLTALAQIVRHRRVVDARNLLDPAAVAACGFDYHGIGIPRAAALAAGAAPSERSAAA